MAKSKDILRRKLIDGLNEDLNLELEAVLRYLYHSSAATGLLGHALRQEIGPDIQGEMTHAIFLADKIAALGGKVHINPKMPKSVRSTEQMMKLNIEAEHRVIANYTDRIQQAEEYGDKGLVTRLEDIRAEETDHAESLQRLAR
tara:strand:+ start:225 stop:656 length:432 start_codon:yes stop_codon:yes gene_type:complete